MSPVEHASNGGSRARSPVRVGLMIGGAIALSLAMVGTGIGIGALIWSGGSCTTTGSSTSSLAPPIRAVTRGVAAYTPVSARGTSVKCPAGAKEPPGDYVVVAYANFTVGPGYGTSVSITGGGENSNCTRDETDASYTSIGPHEFTITAKTGGICGIERSHSNFDVKVTGPGINGSGRMWLGQDRPGGGYYVSCKSEGKPRPPPGVPRAPSDYKWSGINCVERDSANLEIVP
jgi:hypothetical protein